MKIRDIEIFQVAWSPQDKPGQRSAFVRVHTDDGLSGIGEASPMLGGIASLGIVARDIAPVLIGKDPLDHAVALDIAFWDLKGKLFNQPIYKLIGGAWQTALPFYASIGGNGVRSVDEVVR